MAVKKRALSSTHPDHMWIDERIGGHGGSYSYAEPDGKAKIYHIGSTSRVVIWFYNLQLLMRFVRRKLWRLYLNCMGTKY